MDIREYFMESNRRGMEWKVSIDDVPKKEKDGTCVSAYVYG